MYSEQKETEISVKEFGHVVAKGEGKNNKKTEDIITAQTLVAK
jgi:hypothetical protein